jgi:hypothetical protein
MVNSFRIINYEYAVFLDSGGENLILNIFFNFHCTAPNVRFMSCCLIKCRLNFLNVIGNIEFNQIVKYMSNHFLNLPGNCCLCPDMSAFIHFMLMIKL